MFRGSYGFFFLISVRQTIRKTEKNLNCIESTKNSAQNFFLSLFLFFLNKTKSQYVLCVCMLYVCLCVCYMCVLWHTCGGQRTACIHVLTGCLICGFVSIAPDSFRVSLLYLHLPTNSSALQGFWEQELRSSGILGKHLTH